MARVIERFEINSPGAEALLKSNGVRNDLLRRAVAVANWARPYYEQALADSGTDTPVRVIADTYIGRARAGATVIAVHPRSLGVERRHGYFRGAMSAARE
jgi:hypothetical protein